MQFQNIALRVLNKHTSVNKNILGLINQLLERRKLEYS